MATLHNPDNVKDLLRKKGKDEGFNWKRIYQYLGADGKIAYAIFIAPHYDDIYQSPYVANPILLMEEGHLTEAGAQFLGVNQNEFNGDAPRKFYRTLIQVEVLSEAPYEYENLDITDGDCSGMAQVISSEELTRKEMSDALVAQGSDPQFLLGTLDEEE